MLCQKCGGNKFETLKTMKVETMGGVVCAVHVEISMCANKHCHTHSMTDEQAKEYRKLILKEYTRKSQKK